jgi:hypothetical protein
MDDPLTEYFKVELPWQLPSLPLPWQHEHLEHFVNEYERTEDYKQVHVRDGRWVVPHGCEMLITPFAPKKKGPEERDEDERRNRVI